MEAPGGGQALAGVMEPGALFETSGSGLQPELPLGDMGSGEQPELPLAGDDVDTNDTTAVPLDTACSDDIAAMTASPRMVSTPPVQDDPETPR